jgi:hypothetical protein
MVSKKMSSKGLEGENWVCCYLLANEKYEGAMSAFYDIVWERRVASANGNKVSQ